MIILWVYTITTRFNYWYQQQHTTKEFLAWNMQTLILHLWTSRSECCELLLQPEGLHPGPAPAVHCTVGVSSLYISYSFLHQARGELESSWGVFKHEGWRRVWGAEQRRAGPGLIWIGSARLEWVLLPRSIITNTPLPASTSSISDVG